MEHRNAPHTPPSPRGHGKKRMPLAAAIVAIAAALIVALVPSAALAESRTVKATKEWGTCTVTVYTDGSAVVGPGTPQGGFDGLDSSIKNLSFEPGVVLPASCRDMFRNSDLKSIDLANIDASHATDMSFMFEACHGLTRLDFPDSFDTSHVTSMYSMIDDCEYLESITFGKGFKTSSVTNLACMFYGDHALKELTLPETFDTSSVTNFDGMFRFCWSLTKLNLPSAFDTSKGTSLSHMFEDDFSLTTLVLPQSFNTASATSMSGMFWDCVKLSSLHLPTKFFDGSKKVLVGAQLGKAASLRDSVYPNDPEHYTGRWVREDGTMTSKSGDEVLSGDESYAGTWIWQPYATVSFDMNGHGQQVPSAKVGLYDAATSARPTDPAATGYDFLGWKLAGSDFDFSSTVKGDITLTANWSEQQFGLTYDPAGGTFAGGTTAKRTDSFGRVSGKPTIADAPTRSGYTFVCWRDKAGNEFKPGDAYELKGDDGLFADDELAAVWKKDATKPTPDGDKGESTPSKQTQSTNGNAKAQTAAKAAPAKAATAKVSSKVPLTGDTTSQAAPTLLAVALASVCGGLALRARRHE